MHTRTHTHTRLSAYACTTKHTFLHAPTCVCRDRHTWTCQHTPVGMAFMLFPNTRHARMHPVCMCELDCVHMQTALTSTCILKKTQFHMHWYTTRKKCACAIIFARDAAMHLLGFAGLCTVRVTTALYEPTSFASMHQLTSFHALPPADAQSSIANAAALAPGVLFAPLDKLNDAQLCSVATAQVWWVQVPWAYVSESSRA